MARGRKMPLYEVMRETNPKVEVPNSTGKAGNGQPTVEPKGERPEAGPRLRLSEVLPIARSAPPPRPVGQGAPLDPSEADRPQGLTVSWPVLLGGAGILIAVVAIIAMIAFSAGADREREQLVPTDGTAPNLAQQPKADRGAGQPETAPGTQGTQGTPGPEVQAKPAAPAQLPVYGDDPRVQGTNYLIVETMLFDDAMEAAQFLTNNGVPSVVVAPEGKDPRELEKQSRALWQVVVREGFTREEYRASDSRARGIRETVQKLGRRWKQDHKGSSDFGSSLWKKFGK